MTAAGVSSSISLMEGTQGGNTPHSFVEVMVVLC